MTAAFNVVIPARYASTRLPGKPLLDIDGRPMVVHVLEKAVASGATQVLVATDHDGIAAAVKEHGYRAVLTRSDHVSGTDRIAEVVQHEGWGDDEIVVNVQGDEPLIEPALIREVAHNLAGHQEAAIATACHRIEDTAALFNPNIVKVVTDRHGYALYFSRAPIPWARDAYGAGTAGLPEQLPESLPAFRHIGIYAYRTAFLKSCALLQPAAIEQLEALEQLRAMWHGYRISVAVTDHAPAVGVDTEEDLHRVRAILSCKRGQARFN